MGDVVSSLQMRNLWVFWRWNDLLKSIHAELGFKTHQCSFCCLPKEHLTHAWWWSSGRTIIGVSQVCKLKFNSSESKQSAGFFSKCSGWCCEPVFCQRHRRNLLNEDLTAFRDISPWKWGTSSGLVLPSPFHITAHIEDRCLCALWGNHARLLRFRDISAWEFWLPPGMRGPASCHTAESSFMNLPIPCLLRFQGKVSLQTTLYSRTSFYSNRVFPSPRGMNLWNRLPRMRRHDCSHSFYAFCILFMLVMFTLQTWIFSCVPFLPPPPLFPLGRTH